jgi:hypothetical protein
MPVVEGDSIEAAPERLDDLTLEFNLFLFTGDSLPL